MSLSQPTLETAFESLVNTTSEAAAITALVNAFNTYAAGAQAATPVLAAGLTLGRAAMSSALVGMNASGAGAAKVATAIKAFWTAVAGGLATSFAGATAIVAPYQTLTTTHVQDAFTASKNAGSSLAASADALAAAIHPKRTGGTVTTAGPTITGIT